MNWFNRQNALALGAFVGIFLVALLLVVFHVSGESAAGGFLLTAGGIFLKGLSTVFDFDFGSSKASAGKDETIANLSKGPNP